MDSNKRIVFEELINRDIMKLKLSERIGHLRLPKSRRKKGWILRKYGLKKPVDGFRKVPVVDPNTAKGFTIKSSDKRRRSYI